eukprot:622097_1
MAAKPNAFDRLKQHVPKQKSKKTAPKEKKKYKLSENEDRMIQMMQYRMMICDMNNTNNDNTSNENTNTENSNNNNNGNINEPSNEHERYSQLEPYEDDSSSDSESHDSSSYTESSSDSESEDEKKEHKQICVRCKAPKPPQHLVNAAVGVVWLKCPRCDGYIHWECVLSLDFVPRDKVWLCGICTKARY